MEAFQTVDKSNWELLKVSDYENVLILPGSKLYINMSTSGPIPNRSLTGWGPKGGYYYVFPFSLHVVAFLLTYDKWFLIVDGSLPQPVSIMHLVMWIMDTLSFEELVGTLYWIFA